MPTVSLFGSTFLSHIWRCFFHGLIVWFRLGDLQRRRGLGTYGVFFWLFFAKREDCDAMPCDTEHDRYHDVLRLCAMAVHVVQRKDRL